MSKVAHVPRFPPMVGIPEDNFAALDALTAPVLVSLGMEGHVITEILFTTTEVAELLGGRVSPKTLANWRPLKLGPPWVRFGGRIFYKSSALAQWRRETENQSPQEYKASRPAETRLKKPATVASVAMDVEKGSAASKPPLSASSPRPSPSTSSKVRRPNLSRRIASSLETAIAKLQASLADESDHRDSVRLVESIGFLNQLLSHKRHADKRVPRV